ncbi:MAG: VWA domain-containing protein [Agarilytica sp.]
MLLSRRFYSLIVALLISLPLHAQVDSDALPPDVRLVIDVSGSMKQNDPENLRQPAVDLLVQLLPKDSKAGVWTFGRWINMLVKHKDVDQVWRLDAQQKSSQINSVGLYTNIGEALEKAAYDLRPGKEKTHRSSIILLTDGMVDIDKDPELNKKEWRRIVDEVLPRLEEAGVKVHTIALSDNADRDLLNKLSLNTDGVAAVAKTADELMDIFLKTFDAAAPMEQVPLTDEGFAIDSSVEEFTALIFRKDPSANTQIIGPDQEVLSASAKSKYVNWYRADKYDLITVKQPLEGQWQVLADMAPKSRVTVVSNLNLRVAPLPNNILKGQQENLTFLLQEDGKTVTSADFLSLMDITATLVGGKDEFDLREIWSHEFDTKMPPSNGKFKVQLPEFEKQGIYELTIVMDGKSFEREFSHQFTTRKPFGATISEKFEDGKVAYVLTARAYNTDVEVSNTKIVATIYSPDGRKKLYPLTTSALDTWQTTVKPQQSGEYMAVIKVRGLMEGGEPFEQEIPAINFSFSLDGGFVEAEEPFFEPTPEPTPEPEPAPEPTPEATPEAKPEPKVEPVEKSGIPPWLLYAVLGLGNILLFGLGFFLFKKLFGSSDNVLEQFSEEKVEEQIEEAQQEEPVAEAVEEEAEDDFEEEEPPMEDIDPVDEEPEPAPEPEPEPDPEPTPEPEPDIDDEDLDPEPMMGMDDGLLSGMEDDLIEEEPPAEPVEDDVTGDEPMDALDDLDQMAVDAEDESSEGSPDAVEQMLEEEEEEDMVTAMLKAQGLDLAEDELDDAISSLIDELENDEDMDDDK